MCAASLPSNLSSEIVPLATGAEARVTNAGRRLGVVLVNGGTARQVPGTWSSTSELLTQELAPRWESLTFVEVRYRVKSWHVLPSCIADARAALDLIGPAQASGSVLVVGFSMGGGVALGVAGDPRVEGVLGLAPWIPEQLAIDGIAGKRFDVVHGSWDRWLPGIPGVSPATGRRGFTRAQALGSAGTYTLIPRGLHGAAVRRRSGALQRLPAWRRWVDETERALAAFVERAGSA